MADFPFDGNTGDRSANAAKGEAQNISFVKGLKGQALRVKPHGEGAMFSLPGQALHPDVRKDFSVQFWVKTTMDAGKPAVILSQKQFPDNSLASQKNPGWVFYLYHGTWAWNMGAGKRRITHERENGQHMPLNDGKWHQLTMTYNSELSQVRLYYDGDNKAIYQVGDSVGFDFSNSHPLVAGWRESNVNSKAGIHKGAVALQNLVDEFNRLGVKKVAPSQLIDLVVDPKDLFNQLLGEMKVEKGADSSRFLASMKTVDLAPVMKARGELMKNPYTVYQIKEFTELAPISKLYSLEGDKISIREDGQQALLESEKLYQPDFDMDELKVWDRALSPGEVLDAYARFFKPVRPVLPENLRTLTAGDWNIWHGGKHFTMDKDGWDARVRIAEILKRENVDVIMMQETYSGGDFIAAELGYYFASTVDWDYLNQGANISVLSRYPIKELYVPKGAPFMNVAVKVAVSQTQDMYVMSNWYGMNQFPGVYDFHQRRFAQSDSIPTLFAGDFNAVPHTDGGKSPASVKMLGAGFTDAYRSLYPDVRQYPGHSHNSGERIDQLYYKGKGIKNRSTKVVNSWPSGFPSDHFLIIATFDLNYTTDNKKR